MSRSWRAERRAVLIRGLVAWAVLMAAIGCKAQVPDEAIAEPVRGHYVWGAEVNVFSPCGSDEEYWIDAESEILIELRDRYMAFGLPAYAPVYVSLYGAAGPVLDCGFCQDFDGSFKVTELLAMASPGPEECLAEAGGQ